MQIKHAFSGDVAVLHLQGKVTEALARYDEALRLKPDYPGAQDNRRKALAQLRSRSSGSR